MAKLCKYYKQTHQVSYDCETWQDVTPPEYRKGDLYESDSSDCYNGPFAILPRTDGVIAFKLLSDKAEYQYSRDKVSWITLGSEDCIKMFAGKRIYFKGNLTCGGDLIGIGTILSLDGFFDVEGNLLSLLHPDDIAKYPCFIRLFNGCNGLVSAKNLNIPIPKSNYALQCMFAGCNSLIEAPVLRNYGTLYIGCYESMFAGCTSLEKAPELSSPNLNEYCYKNMFSGCTSLNYIKCSATYISPRECTLNWLSGVSQTGTFVTPSSTGWQSGESGIPVGWERINE